MKMNSLLKPYLCSSEDDTLAKVFQHEWQSTGCIRHGISAMQNHKPARSHHQYTENQWSNITLSATRHSTILTRTGHGVLGCSWNTGIYSLFWSHNFPENWLTVILLKYMTASSHWVDCNDIDTEFVTGKCGNMTNDSRLMLFSREACTHCQSTTSLAKKLVLQWSLQVLAKKVCTPIVEAFRQNYHLTAQMTDVLMCTSSWSHLAHINGHHILLRLAEHEENNMHWPIKVSVIQFDVFSQLHPLIHIHVAGIQEWCVLLDGVNHPLIRGTASPAGKQTKDGGQSHSKHPSVLCTTLVFEPGVGACLHTSSTTASNKSDWQT